MSELARVAQALNNIGIPTQEDSQAAGFLDNVRIKQGVIHYKPNALIADILHEAGHLACLPALFRPQANDDLDDLAVIMCDYADAQMARGVNPEAPILRAIMQCSDGEATAWAWAFGSHLGLDPKVIIDGEAYGGEGDSVRLMVSTGMYLGVNGLRAAGMIKNTKDYPKLDKWLQDAVEEEI